MQSVRAKLRLVLGCGKKSADKCKHSPDYWFSVDSSASKQPDLCKRPSQLTPDDFAANGGVNKFKMIYIENIPPFLAPKMNVLKPLLDNADGVLAYSNWEGSWNDFEESNLDVVYYLYYHNKLVLFIGESELSENLEILRLQAFQDADGSTAAKESQLIEQKILHLYQDNRDLPGLLISFLAQVHMYVDLRKERHSKLGFLWQRNKNKDPDYEHKLLPAVEETIQGLASGRFTLEQVLQRFEAWKRDYPSSALPSAKDNDKPSLFSGLKVKYTKLEKILSVGEEAVKFYARQYRKVQLAATEENKPAVAMKGP